MFIVTGGGTGIGRALALALAARQQKVLIIGRHKKSLHEVAALSSYILPLPANVATRTGRQKIVTFVQDIPSLQGIVHCAVAVEPIMSVCNISLDAWNVAMNTNFHAPLFLTQSLYKKLSNGRLLQLSSLLERIPIKGLTAYCTSKAALAMLIRCWQLDNLSMAVTSAKIGIVDTNYTQLQILKAAYLNEDFRATFKKLKTQNRLIRPETVALFLTWLLLDVDKNLFVSEEWDIEDTTHHSHWLVAPHVLPILDPVKDLGFPSNT